MTLDNEEARIVIGRTCRSSPGRYDQQHRQHGHSEPGFQTTVERKDVGLTLKVRPQISEERHGEDGYLPGGPASRHRHARSTPRPHHQQASIESNVVVDDGQIIVLGGLLEDE